MTSTGDIEGNAAQLDRIEARDDRICKAARAVVATQDKASRDIWLYGAYMESVRERRNRAIFVGLDQCGVPGNISSVNTLPFFGLVSAVERELKKLASWIQIWSTRQQKYLQSQH